MNKALIAALFMPVYLLAKDNSDYKTKTVYKTNYIQVPVICATLDVADYQLAGGHSYKVIVADGIKPWRSWGIIRPTTNTLARIWFPPASIRPIQWQVIDVTPGFQQQALIKQAPDCITKPQWVVSGIGNIRPVK